MPSTVGIVTRTRNRPQLLPRALQTVANQTFTDYVHIIVNDGGDPDVVTTCIAELSPDQAEKIVRIDNPVSLGREAAVNPGLAKSLELGTRYSVVLDDDDSWDPEFLSTLVEYLDEHEKDVAVASAVEIIYETEVEGRFVETRRERLASDVAQITFGGLLRRNFLAPVCLLYRTELLKTLQGWRTDSDTLADWDFNLRLAILGSIGFVNTPLALWHWRDIVDTQVANSVIADAQSHRETEGRIRDDYLRRYLVSGDSAPNDVKAPALGIPLLLGGYAVHLGDQLSAQSRHIEAIKDYFDPKVGAIEASLRPDAGAVHDRLNHLEAQLELALTRLENLDAHLAAIGEQNTAILHLLQRQPLNQLYRGAGKVVQKARGNSDPSNQG